MQEVLRSGAGVGCGGAAMWPPNQAEGAMLGLGEGLFCKPPAQRSPSPLSLSLLSLQAESRHTHDTCQLREGAQTQTCSSPPWLPGPCPPEIFMARNEELI